MIGFGEKSYDLGMCVLRQPTQEDANYLSAQLANIEPWKTLGSTPKGLEEGFLYQDDSTNTYAVMVENEAVGLVSVRYPWLVGPYLGFLGFVPSAQGKGFGKRLMKWLEECAVAHSARNVFICVSEFNHEAQMFYQSCGYTKVADLDGLIVNEYAELLLRKRLS